MKKLLLLSFSTLLISPAYADENQLSGYVAGGVFATSDYEGSKDYQAVPLLSGKLSYDQYYIESRGLGVRANISPAEQYDFGPVVTYQMARDDDVDNNRVAALREVDNAFNVGAFVKIPITGVSPNPYDQLAFEAEILADASGVHDGYVVNLGASYSFPFSRQFRVSSSLSTTYADENYMLTYFGIDSDNSSRSGLAEYEADEGFKNIGLGLNANYAFNKKWGVIGLVGYDRLIGDAADSPIVENEGSANQFRVGTGLTYRF